MKICIDSVKTEDARRVLFLMSAFKGESIPEDVLRILCAGMKISNSAFMMAKDELCMRELLEPSAETLASKMHLEEDANDGECSAWSLLTLVRLYLQQHMFGKQEMRAMIGSLIGDDECSPESSTKYNVQQCEAEIEEIGTGSEAERAESEERKVTIALCALYFDHQHTDHAVTRAVVKAYKISNLEDSPINDLRRKAVEPLIWLLDKPEEDEEWTAMDKCCVRKVLLEYICRRQLDSENISYLLKLAACPSAQLATLKAITHITNIEEMPLINENTIRFVTIVVDIMNLRKGYRTGVQEAASAALRGICWKAAYDKSSTLVTNMSGVLDVLTNSLAIPSSKSDKFAQNAASAIAGLAYRENLDNSQMSVRKQRLVPSLVKCLYQQSKPSLQIQAVKALVNLTFTNESLRLKVAGEEGALICLVNCLLKDDNKELQTEEASRALANLAASTDESLRLKIVNESGALVAFVN